MQAKACPHRCVFAIEVLDFVPTGFHEFLFCFRKRFDSLRQGLEAWLVLADETRGRDRMDELVHTFQVFRSDAGNKSPDYIHWIWVWDGRCHDERIDATGLEESVVLGGIELYVLRC